MNTKILPSILNKTYDNTVLRVKKYFFKITNNLKQDTLELKNAQFRHENQKAFYENKNIPYLLPHQSWSDKKILATVNLLGEQIDVLVKSKNLNKHTLQEAIDKLTPNKKGKIIIKDFND